MNLLLDTHVLLWCFDNDSRLGKITRTAITDGHNQVFVSAASLWEISIKKQTGKLSAPDDVKSELDALRFETFPINHQHAQRVYHIPLIHKDPFDRMLIAQALCENFTLVTQDQAILQYDCRLLNAKE